MQTDHPTDHTPHLADLSLLQEASRDRLDLRRARKVLDATIARVEPGWLACCPD